MYFVTLSAYFKHDSIFNTYNNHWFHKQFHESNDQSYVMIFRLLESYHVIQVNRVWFQCQFSKCDKSSCDDSPAFENHKLQFWCPVKSPCEFNNMIPKVNFLIRMKKIRLQYTVWEDHYNNKINLENQDLHTFRDFFDSRQTDSSQDGTEITTCQDCMVHVARTMDAILTIIKGCD